MWSQSRNNRRIVRPTPAVPNRTCVLTRSQTAMTTTDISLSAELVCSTERIRRRSKNSMNALRCTNVAAQIFRIFHPGFSLATHSLATQSGLLQNRATKTKFINIFFFSRQAGFNFSINTFFSFFLSELLNYINRNIYD